MSGASKKFSFCKFRSLLKKMAGALALAVIFGACGIGSGEGRDSRGDTGVLVIGERFFVHQVHDIWLNTSQYLGRTIQYEGIFRTVQWRMTGYDHIVIRYTVCCGEVPIGFFILVPDDFYPLPPEESWVEITGVVEMHEGALMVRAVSLIEMEERGAGFVEFGWQ